MIRKKKYFPGVRAFGRKLLISILHIVGEDKNITTLEGALQRCTYHTPEINTVIDVGASDGRWSKICLRYYSQAKYLLIEAQNPHLPALENFTKDKKSQIDYIISAAGDADTSINFDASDLLGGIASHSAFDKNNIVVPMVKVDTLVADRHLRPPYLIKLDTHGFELPILDGAKETLKNTALIVIETYNFNFTNENLRFHQMTLKLEELGFRCVDLSDPLHRPFDKSLYQFDLYFIPATHPLFSDNQYH